MEYKFFTNNFHHSYFLFYIFIIFSLITICQLISTLDFPQSITLLNGNIFVIHKYGIDIYDSSLENKVKNILNFTGDNCIDSTDKLKKNIISRFSPEEYGFIISIINDIIFIFDCEGNFLYKNTTKICEQSNVYYELLPIKSNKEELTFMIGYVNSSDYIHLNFYKYNLINNNTYNINNIILILSNTYIKT